MASGDQKYNIKLSKSRSFPHPLITGTVPGCEYCTWTWTPAIGGDDTPWTLKFANRACPDWKHSARAGQQDGNE